MARRNRSASAVNPSKRACPVCASKRVHGMFEGRETIRNRRIDVSSCTCLDCSASWQEEFMVRAQEIKVSDVRPGGQQDAQDLTKLNSTSTPVTTIDASRLCPVCGSDATSAGFNGSSTGSEGRIDKATAGCTSCGALWGEAYYRRTGKTVISDVRPAALKAALQADKANAQRAQMGTNVPKQAAPADLTPIGVTTSHSHDEDDGSCPMCHSLHIGIKPHGNAAASCVCGTCGASWDHRYVAGEGKAYRSNVKPRTP